MPRRRRFRAGQPITKRGVRGLRFEPLERREMLAADFGDAAGSSGTPYDLASHEAVGPMLGVLRDANSLVTNSLANADAQDEDGVAFGFLRSGQAGSMTVYVTNAPAGARLDAWIDFARDTNFADPFDQIVDNLAVVEGDNVVTFNVPATVAGGHYYVRVRLSTAGNLAYALGAADGEVEDYLIPIAHADSGPFGGQQPISFNDAAQVVPTDIDSDGDLDLLTNRLTWIENVAGRYGAELQVASSSTATVVSPIDFDGDGDMDVVATISGSSLRLYENNGNQTFASRTIDASVTSPWFHVVDLDNDADLDILNLGSSASIRWMRNNADGSFTLIAINGSPTSVKSLTAADMDGDGDLDILAASSAAGQGIQWLENDGSENFTSRQVGPSDSAVLNAIAVDLDSDGDLDVVGVSPGTTRVTWYENDGAESFTAHLIAPTQPNLESAAVADFDADGDLDIAVSGLERVGWYVNDGAEAFTYREIARLLGTQLSIAVADLDGDGRLDLATTGLGSAPVAWYRNFGEYDFGDAPHPYNVHLQDNGARHNAVGPKLGAQRDAEADGAHSPAGAEAEDDGVTFGAVEIGEGVGLVTVNVQNAPAGARLDAWIDFNGDGTWAGGEEQIFTSLAVVEGDNVLAFAIPSWAVPGATFARFRLSTAGGLGANGAALDGEVEDHPVTLPSRDPATGLFSGPTTILAAGSRDHLAAADVDSDGDVDVVTKTSNNLVWFENLGAAGFVSHIIPNSKVGVEDFAIGDLDGDGDVDFISFASDGFVWIENDGQQNFTRHVQAIPPSFEVPINAPVAYALADIDADGDCDVIVADLGEGVFALLNDGQQQFTARAIEMSAGLISNSSTTVAVADVDRDGDLDIVAGGVRTQSGVGSWNVTWYQNDGALKFTPRIVKTRPTFPSDAYTESVAVGDIDGDGDLDVVASGRPNSPNLSTPGVNVTWHEQVAGNQWVQHDLDVGGWSRWVELADFDADGDLDIVSTGWQTPTVLYENSGAGRFFRRQLTPGITSGWSVAAADMDGDGDLDIVSPGSQGGPPIVWFENIDLVDPDFGDAPGQYPTLRADSGPVHNGGGPRLGATRDSETDGAPTPAADGDAGDDGVTLPAVQVGDAGGTLVVNVQNAPAGAKLDAWIDFNGDGSFDVAGEQIFVSRAVVEGDNALSFNIPANTPGGAIAARFRISTAGGLRPIGVAVDGEVEDYLLTIAPPGAATAEYGPGRRVREQAESIRVADMDGDGDADFLTVSGIFPYLQWHENLGDGAFLAHDNGLTGPVAGARPVDFNRDGDMDIVVITSNGLAWYDNNGAEAFTFRSIASTPTSLLGVFDIADVDGDGDLDVIASRSNSSTQPIIILLNDGQQGFAASIPVAAPTTRPAAIRAADIDGDGDADFAVVDATRTGWFKNNGRQWSYQALTPAPGGDGNRIGRDIVPIDFDGDGDVDLVTLAHSLGVVLELFRNDGTEVFTRETLATTLAPAGNTSGQGGDRLQVADLDGDGDLDAVAAAYADTRVYRNDGQGPFTQLVINMRTLDSYAPVAVADLDADGRLEILGSGTFSTGLYWLDDLPFGDYNRDGSVNQADRDLYEATIGQTATPPGAGADGDRSGIIDPADLAIWEANQGRGPAPVYRPADFDQNESISGHDFLRWQQRVGVPPSGSAYIYDADVSGAVDGGDLAVWTRHFGQGVPRAILTAESSLAAESAESFAPTPATFTLAVNVFLEAPAPVAFEEEAFVDDDMLIDATAFDAALTSMNPPPFMPASKPDRSLPAASRSQKAPRLLPDLADKLLGDLWSD